MERYYQPEIETASREQIKAWQDERLVKQVRRVWDNVPYYRTRLKPITGMTGHQQNPTTGYNIKGDPAGKIDLEALCRAMGFNRVRVVDPYDLKATDAAVKEELAADEPSVIISRRPCALLKYVKHKAPLAVDPVKCVGCRSCMKIACPAISIKEGKAHVDATLCVGCGVCEQLCGVKAFRSTGKEG